MQSKKFRLNIQRGTTRFGHSSVRFTQVLRPLTCLGILAALVPLAGCGNDTFAKVNGQEISNREYVKALERQSIQVQNGQPTNAERMVLDQLIGNRVILAEAAKAGVAPTDADVNSFYNQQKKQFEQQFPDKEYEKTLADQGATPEEVKKEMRAQLAETELYAKKLDLKEDEVKKAFEQLKASGRLGMPLRVQLRLVLVPAGSPAFTEVKQKLDQKQKFEDVARQFNANPQLKASGGLLPQPIPMANVAGIGLPKEAQAKVQAASDGSIFGPYDLPAQPGQPAPPNKVWVMVEKKLPAVVANYDESRAVVRRFLVSQKIMSPENARIRDEIMNQKMAAKFEASNKDYEKVWQGVKTDAQKAGVGQAGAVAAPKP